MPALVPTDYCGTVSWFGHVTNRKTALASASLPAITATFAGLQTESHAGLTRKSCARVRSQYPIGTEIRNTRQFSIVSNEELAEIARVMDVEQVKPEWIGASIVLHGLPDFSHIPPASRLQFSDGTTLTVDIQNRPCMLPAPVIDAAFPEKGRLFKSAAKGLRGITAWVEREGTIRIGDSVTLHIPDQRPWKLS